MASKKTPASKTVLPKPEPAAGDQQSQIDPALLALLKSANIDPSTITSSSKKLTLAKQSSDLAQPFLDNLRRGASPGEFSQSMADWQDQLSAYYSKIGKPHLYQRGYSDPTTYADTVEVAAFMYENGFSDMGRALDALSATGSDSANAARATYKAGVIGGGGRYTIDLTNPNEIGLVADRSAFALLGRKATAEERQKLITGIQGQERTEGQKRIDSAEAEKQAQFGARVMERDSSAAAAAAQATGAAPGGGGVGGQGLLSAARQFKGTPYGTTGGHLDCSALVQQAAKAMGIDLPRTTFEQVNAGAPVADISQAQPGDLIFFNTEGRANNHVGIYAGNGMMIDSNHTGGSVDERPVYSGISAIRRLAGGSGGASATATPGTRPVQVGSDIYLPSSTTEVTRAPSPEAEAYSMYTAPGSGTELEYGAHQAATSVYDAMIRAIKTGETGTVAGGGASSVV